MNKVYLTWFVLLLGLCLTQVEARSIKKIETVGPSNNSCWDYFMLVQRWPYSTCQIVNASGSPCLIPERIHSWTLHGLWPDNINTYPTHCGNETFDNKKIEGLEEELLMKWPNLYEEETVDSLWKHEFEKHGTCAQSLESFKEQRSYFTNTLAYFDKWNVADVLAQQGILPRIIPYKASTLVNAIQKGYDKIVCPGCGHIEGFGQILSQVYMCIDQADTLVNCPTCEKECHMDQPVYYQPNHPKTFVDPSVNSV
uniref:Uncharacterized protein n=2 Tax=Clytia hemisphaerica TaxID=252671 RepID=A0A7M5WWI4_9CNID